MEIRFWGAARTVTGSMHLLTVNGRRLLLDCGLYQGKRSEAYDRNKNLPFDAGSIDACVLSHAHIDHSGDLPMLAKNGFRGSIYATSATRDLCSYMLLDAAQIQESDVRHVNKRRADKGEPPFKPLYVQADAIEALKRFVSVEYHRAFEPIPGVRVMFQDSGHILGSAMVVLEVTEGGRQRRLVFSGDLGRKNLPVLRDPETVDRADVLITEGTYGGRFHKPIENSRGDLADIIARTVKRGGLVIVPSFAVGRTQELVYDLHQLFEADRLPPIPIYVDSPLAVNITEVFRLHPEVYDQETADFVTHLDGRDPFGFSRLTYIRNAEKSKELNERHEPAVIIAASGMCEAGRVLHHLMHHVGDPRNTVLFVGYQAQDTLGRKLLDGWKRVRIFGDEYDVAAEIAKLEGYSAHADHNGLVGFAREMTQKPQQTFIVHAELEPAEALRQGLLAVGLPNVSIPNRGDVAEIQ
ncbi:MAG TPA: MBL fold metallo-hydrolase [Anaerolineae bacterium]|nr:MBL fold metallo-hydrolase [Anaerolineae bacterium]